MMSDSVLKIDGLCHAYKNHEILKNIDLDLRAGERIAVLGESGSGKSTLLRCIAGSVSYTHLTLPTIYSV